MAKKWHTTCSCGQAQDLEKMINDYYYSKGYVIGEAIDENHFKVYNTETSRFLKGKGIVRFYRKRWQFGYYTEE